VWPAADGREHFFVFDSMFLWKIWEALMSHNVTQGLSSLWLFQIRVAIPMKTYTFMVSLNSPLPKEWGGHIHSQGTQRLCCSMLN
jgi:hypothetical protein